MWPSNSINKIVGRVEAREEQFKYNNTVPPLLPLLLRMYKGTANTYARRHTTLW